MAPANSGDRVTTNSNKAPPRQIFPRRRSMEGASESEDLADFDPSDLIGQGKVWRDDLPAAVRTACKSQRAFPNSVRRRLPMPHAPVSELLSIRLPPILDDAVPFSRRASSWFSLDPPNCVEDDVHPR